MNKTILISVLIALTFSFLIFYTFHEFFDTNYSSLEDKMYWSTGNLPYLHDDVTNLLLKSDDT